jgi:hypothetical protein
MIHADVEGIARVIKQRDGCLDLYADRDEKAL